MIETEKYDNINDNVIISSFIFFGHAGVFFKENFLFF
jgi:hypothetical protein